MKSLRDNCIELLQNEDIRKDMRDMIKPIVQIVYNELYIYIWVICLYNVFIFFILIMNLYMLFKINRQMHSVSFSYSELVKEALRIP